MSRHGKRGVERSGKVDRLGTGWGRAQLARKLKRETTRAGLH